MAILGELDVAAKLAEFEELFKYRYTEKDDGYREALRRGSRWYQVPVMDPWPPRKPRPPWKEDPEPRRRYYRDPPPPPEEWDRRDPHPHYRRYRDPPPPPPPGYSDHWNMAPHHPYDYPPPHHHFPPPPPHLYRQRSHSPSPPSPHHHRHHHHWEERERTRREEAIKHSGAHQRTDATHEQPVIKPQETDSDSQKDSDTKFSSGYPAIEEESAPPPSESDVMAILSSASGAQNSVTSENLKKVQKQAKQLEKQKQKARRDSNKSLSERTSTNKGDTPKSISSPKSLQITHGKPQSVTVNLLLEGLQSTHQPFYSSTQAVRKPPRRKRKAGSKLTISSDSASSESEIDPVTVDNEPSPVLALSAQKPLSTFYGAAIAPANNSPLGSSEPASLMVHIDNHLLSPPGESISAKLHSLSQTGGDEQTNSVPKKKKKKKHKKKLKLDDEYQEEQKELEEAAAVSNEGSLKLKISLKK